MSKRCTSPGPKGQLEFIRTPVSLTRSRLRVPVCALGTVVLCHNALALKGALCPYRSVCSLSRDICVPAELCAVQNCAVKPRGSRGDTVSGVHRTDRNLIMARKCTNMTVNAVCYLERDEVRCTSVRTLCVPAARPAPTSATLSAGCGVGGEGRELERDGLREERASRFCAAEEGSISLPGCGWVFFLL